mmetsp:Transcript_7610/g.31497  ORF Transcript_7610/g.31497 Transcript_7610/m.31497 type:complete len:322 (-) Transcript_7610:127-1092(-)
MVRRFGGLVGPLLLLRHGPRAARGLAQVPPPKTPPRRVAHFINLTNGLEALDALDAAQIDPRTVNFCRIQSSHCEAADFYGILQNLDHNLLFHLATGADCVVYDLGSRGTRWPAVHGDEASTSRDGPAEEEEDAASSATECRAAEVRVPRAIWWGVEWARYALATVWHCEHRAAPLLRGYHAAKIFDAQLGRLPKPLYKRLKYYRKFGPDAVRLRGAYWPAGTTLDGQDAVYAAMARSHADRVAAALGGALEPTPGTTTPSSRRATVDDETPLSDVLDLPPGFVEYRSSDYIGVGRHRIAAAAPKKRSQKLKPSASDGSAE